VSVSLNSSKQVAADSLNQPGQENFNNEKLPQEVVEIILRNLQSSDLQSASLACKAWNQAARSTVIRSVTPWISAVDKLAISEILKIGQELTQLAPQVPKNRDYWLTIDASGKLVFRPAHSYPLGKYALNQYLADVDSDKRPTPLEWEEEMFLHRPFKIQSTIFSSDSTTASAIRRIEAINAFQSLRGTLYQFSDSEILQTVELGKNLALILNMLGDGVLSNLEKTFKLKNIQTIIPSTNIDIFRLQKIVHRILSLPFIGLSIQDQTQLREMGLYKVAKDWDPYLQKPLLILGNILTDLLDSLSLKKEKQNCLARLYDAICEWIHLLWSRISAGFFHPEI